MLNRVVRRVGSCAVLLMLAGAVLVPATAAAEGPTPPAVTTAGVKFVTSAGVPVVLRGVNISDHSRYMTLVPQLGANFVRLRVLWADVEPAPGLFDLNELARLDTFVQYFNDNHIAVELDLRGLPVPSWYGSTVGFFRSQAERSQAAYEPFVQEIVNRYDSYPYVVGYGIFNEPHPFAPGVGTHGIDQTILRWQSAIRNEVLAIDPYRVVFFSVRGGNYGIAQANFKLAGFGLAHTVLDWHDFYNGRYGSGFDAANDNWLPDWVATHNQMTSSYSGTQVNQWLNLDIPWRRTHILGIPMIVGEWGILNSDPNKSIYDAQMSALFAKAGLSWARWDMDNQHLGLVTGRSLNSEGLWLQQLLTGG